MNQPNLPELPVPSRKQKKRSPPKTLSRRETLTATPGNLPDFQTAPVRYKAYNLIVSPAQFQISYSASLRQMTQRCACLTRNKIPTTAASLDDLRPKVSVCSASPPLDRDTPIYYTSKSDYISCAVSRARVNGRSARKSLPAQTAPEPGAGNGAILKIVSSNASRRRKLKRWQKRR